ncbi:glutamate--cysteine ligase [Rhodococcus sp. T2V]|uniref:carboxylate-amine ligase n=1 Tax=Rhodococcus sp. T2V TaxID=3034164 RepID=UPI0023E1150D|nr:glutamate--cysteine ligase [Rhodococcus sp. T2V]MDF3312008.1 glutamate--cysteine ligase [Rhodococcus sp. T2V]
MTLTPSTDPVDLTGIGESELRLTMGVEEEFVLVDPDTGAPFLGNSAVAAAGQALGIDLQLELSRCQIETATPVCTQLADLQAEVRRARTLTAAAAAQTGAALLAVGVPPFGRPPRSITDLPRYRRLADHYGQLGEQVICGAHVHIGIPDREVAVQVSNHLRPWLPALLALTANSPIIAGRDTGYASWRHMLWARWPGAGPPPYFDSAGHYDDEVVEMLEYEVILDPAMIYWDVRVSAHLPTVEVRVADVPATVEETVLLAVLVRALVAAALRAIRGGHRAPRVDPHRLRSAYWRAARDGITGRGIDLASGCRVPATEPIRRLLDHIRPVLEAAGDYHGTRAEVMRILATGNGAARQRRVLQDGTLPDVLDMLIHSTADTA